MAHSDDLPELWLRQHRPSLACEGSGSPLRTGKRDPRGSSRNVSGIASNDAELRCWQASLTLILGTAQRG